jgi:hypothetical protein
MNEVIPLFTLLTRGATPTYPPKLICIPLWSRGLPWHHRGSRSFREVERIVSDNDNPS